MTAPLPFPSLLSVVSSDSWGPSSLPEKYKDVPYTPFVKSERLGRIADWTMSAAQSAKGAAGGSRVGTTAFASSLPVDDEDTFHIVDTRTTQKKPFGQRPRFAPNRDRFVRRDDKWGPGGGQNQPGDRKDGQRGGAKTQQGGRFGGQNTGNRWNDPAKPIVIREPSVNVTSEWEIIDQITSSNLSKLTEDVPEPETIKECGRVRLYDRMFDRITTKTEQKLRRVEKPNFERVSTSNDPIIQQLAAAGEGHVFFTDSILATLMTSPRSVFSWDIVVTKKGDQLFFDKRDNSTFDHLTVSETANEPPSDDKEVPSINSQTSLSMEATVVNALFASHVAKESSRVLSDDADSNSRRYRKFELDDETIVVCRCDLDAAVEGKDENELQFCLLRALHEWDPKTGVNWRKQLDSQRGAVLATEMHDNAHKMATWCAQALLSGVDFIKLGYISRHSVRDPTVHVILGTQQCKPPEFASQMNINLKNLWGAVRYFVDVIRKESDGKYVVMKDPNKPTIRVYRVPANAFDAVEARIPRAFHQYETTEAEAEPLHSELPIEEFEGRRQFS
eukprot:c2066_g1_i1.p1 GENE.c2066_g1_i1~~c2066_g1_i1.p1  ORF type:complete len:560 (+),score=119.84 c2066_g1_i1:50-1729(+)